MNKTTSTEFIMWQDYLEKQKTEEVTKLDWYLAQIAYEIRLSNWKIKSKQMRINDFFSKFKKSVKQDIPSTAQSIKNALMGILGLSKK